MVRLAVLVLCALGFMAVYALRPLLPPELALPLLAIPAAGLLTLVVLCYLDDSRPDRPV